MDRDRSTSSPLRISIEGFPKGSRQFDFLIEPDDVDGLVEEYKDDINVSGVLHRIGRRLHLDATVETTASLICDRSLEKYSEEISVDISVEYEFDNELAAEQEAQELDDEEVLGLYEDAKFIEIDNEVRQVLALALPMKRIAPPYRGKEIDEIHPELKNKGEEKIDSRWDALKKLKNN